MSFALSLSNLQPSTEEPKRRFAHRRDDSLNGSIRSVLAADPHVSFRACEVHRSLGKRSKDVDALGVASTLNKLARWRHVRRIKLPGEWFFRYQAFAEGRAE